MSAYLAQNNISADFYNSTEDCISRIISGSYSLIAMNIGYYSDWVSAIITIHRQSTVPIVLISEKRNSGSAEASYTYNANNLRASKTVNREKIDFVWNGQNLAAENKSGEVNTYTYDPTGVHIANQNGNITSYLKDYHGNVVGTTTVAGTMVQEENNRMDYDAFGNQWIGDTPDPFGYCGEYYDSESGLVYLRNRYYDSASGRFITEDPIKDGFNWYNYCSSNPVILIDPSGLVEVLLKYIVEKNNGQISWDANANVATVSFPGYAPIKAEGRIVNGRTIVDSEWLKSNFNLTEYSANHLDGGLFESVEDAILAVTLQIADKSFDEQQEYAAAINVINLRYGDRYWFTNITNSSDKAGKSLSQLTDKERREVGIQVDDNSVAYIHTHWRENGNKDFTYPQDYEAAFSHPKINDIYLLNSDKDVLRVSRDEYSRGRHYGTKIFSIN